MGDLQRIVIDLRSGEMVLRCLYRTQDGPSPNTKARTREEMYPLSLGPA